VQYGDILIAVNDMATPDWGAYVEARALVPGHMRVELCRAGVTLVMEFDMAAQTEPVDAAALLDELIEHGMTPPPGNDPRREPAPS
jgi:hypothetical protein